MSWRVHVPNRIKKLIKRFPQDDFGRILKVLREFEVDPWQGDIVKTDHGENTWRRRVGNYRIIYFVSINLRLIEIKEIRRRTSSMY